MEKSYIDAAKTVWNVAYNPIYKAYVLTSSRADPVRGVTDVNAHVRWVRRQDMERDVTHLAQMFGWTEAADVTGADGV